MPRLGWLLVGILGLVVLGVGWFLFSPLLIDEVVDEGFPTSAQVAAMSNSEKAAAMTAVMDKMATVPDRQVSEQMLEVGALDVPEPVRRGVFVGADALHQGDGNVTEYRLPSGEAVLRFEAFAVTNGPALVVYLSKEPNPTSAEEVLTGFLDLGPLKGNKGNQNYSVSEDVDLSEYRSVVIWCELFDVLFAVAPLAVNPAERIK